jgi:hypothetical protein
MPPWVIGARSGLTSRSAHNGAAFFRELIVGHALKQSSPGTCQNRSCFNHHRMAAQTIRWPNAITGCERVNAVEPDKMTSTLLARQAHVALDLPQTSTPVGR